MRAYTRNLRHSTDPALKVKDYLSHYRKARDRVTSFSDEEQKDGEDEKVQRLRWVVA